MRVKRRLLRHRRGGDCCALDGHDPEAAGHRPRLSAGCPLVGSTPRRVLRMFQVASYKLHDFGSCYLSA